MKIITFIEAEQGDVIRKILEHCDLWYDPPPRAPSVGCGASQPVPPASACGPGYGSTDEADPQFLKHARRDERICLISFLISAPDDAGNECYVASVACVRPVCGPFAG